MINKFVNPFFGEWGGDIDNESFEQNFETILIHFDTLTNDILGC